MGFKRLRPGSTRIEIAELVAVGQQELRPVTQHVLDLRAAQPADPGSHGCHGRLTSLDSPNQQIDVASAAKAGEG